MFFFGRTTTTGHLPAAFSASTAPPGTLGEEDRLLDLRLRQGLLREHALLVALGLIPVIVAALRKHGEQVSVTRTPLKYKKTTLKYSE